MKYVKLAVISAMVFGTLLFMMSLLIPSHIRISRAIDIESSKDIIAPYLSDTSKWPQWNEINLDSINVKVIRSSRDSIRTHWNYKGRSVNSSFALHESDRITVVQWYFDFHLKWYPWEKFSSITLDKQFGGPMENSLNKLKNLIEKTP